MNAEIAGLLSLWSALPTSVPSVGVELADHFPAKLSHVTWIWTVEDVLVPALYLDLPKYFVFDLMRIPDAA